jgi:hypothetical protein
MATFIELTHSKNDLKLVINLDNMINFEPNLENDKETVLFFNVIVGGNGFSRPNMITVKESYEDIKDIIKENGNQIGEF